MGVLDSLSGLASRFSPSKSSKPSTVMSGGIGHGMVSDDNMIVSKPSIVFHSSQIFFNFLAMCCFASVAAFQAKWKVGPSGLTGFAIFVSIAGMFLSTFMLMVPVVYEKYDKFVRLARALKEVRVGCILTGVGVTFSLLISFIVTISAWTQPGCKNPDNDPHSSLGKDFKAGLGGWCSTKKAGAIFFWLAFGFWLASGILLIMDWRSGKLHAPAPPRDPPFTRPEPQDLEDGLAEEEDDEDEDYTHVPRPAAYPSSSSYPSSNNTNSSQTRYDPPTSNAAGSPFADENQYNPPPSSTGYVPAQAVVAAGRQSMDAYGAFSDPAPSGFAGPPPAQEPRVSRTMQYADPYAAVRASIGGAGVGAPAPAPPSYESYQGYR